MAHRQPFYARIGSISTGTLHPDHLADTYVTTLQQFIARDNDADRRKRAQAAVAEYQRLHTSEARDADMLEWSMETAWPLLEEYAPPYVSLRSHEGDGADIGYFPDIDTLETDARYREGVLKVNAGDTWPRLPADIDYIFEVNDHGNVTLYNARSRQEIWSCV